MSTQFLATLPFLMQLPIFTMWQRLVEAGIDGHLKRLNIALYRAIRRDRLRANSLVINTNVVDLIKESNEAIGSDLMLLLIVLSCGYTLAGFAFLNELWSV